MSKPEITQERCAGTGAVKRSPLPKGAIGITDPFLPCPGCPDCKPKPSETVQDDPQGCTCKTEEYGEHPCPYQDDLNNDQTPCRCCPWCIAECAMDI